MIPETMEQAVPDEIPDILSSSFSTAAYAVGTMLQLLLTPWLTFEDSGT